MLLNIKARNIRKYFYKAKSKFYYFFLLSIFWALNANPATALEINFTDHEISKKLTEDAQQLFGFILPEAHSLDLCIESIDAKETAVMTVILDKINEDGFMIMKEVPKINSHTYLIAWMLQGHFYFLKEQAKTERQKRHLKLLSRYFDGRNISGSDTFYTGKLVELFYNPLQPKVRGLDLNISAFSRVLYSGVANKDGFAKITVPGFRPKYIAILPSIIVLWFIYPL